MPAPRAMLEECDRLLRGGQAQQALPIARRLVQLAPADPSAALMLGGALFLLGNAQEALPHARRAATLAPTWAYAHSLTAQCCMKLPDPSPALPHLRKAAELEPSNFAHHNLLGAFCLVTNRVEEAATHLRRAHELNPSDALVAVNLARALGDLCQTSEALRVLRMARATHTSSFPVLLGYAGLLNYVAEATPQEKLAAAKDLARVLTARARPAPTSPSPPARPSSAELASRAVRVGLVSFDLRQHSCAYFLRSVLRHLDPARFELHCFHLYEHADAMTAELRGLCEARPRGGSQPVWHAIGPNDPAKLSTAIRAAGIDIAIDLGGHTACSGLESFPFGPAPILATMLGYPATTGLSGMWRIVDAITDPPASDALHTESLIRMQGCFLCYEPRDAQGALPPARNARDGRANAAITFGSFNAPKKISTRTLDLWAGVLRGVPASTLVLKGASMEGTVAPAWLRSQFQQRGIDPARLEFLARTQATTHHLSLYDRMDIALDTSPYCGTTTTCEALLMGVPVVTLAGQEHVERVGASLLTHAGLPELIAHTSEDYITIASALANDVDRLAALHAGLRERVLASALCDGPAHARALANALEHILTHPLPR